MGVRVPHGQEYPDWGRRGVDEPGGLASDARATRGAQGLLVHESRLWPGHGDRLVGRSLSGTDLLGEQHDQCTTRLRLVLQKDAHRNLLFRPEKPGFSIGPQSLERPGTCATEIGRA